MANDQQNSEDKRNAVDNRLPCGYASHVGLECKNPEGHPGPHSWDESMLQLPPLHIVDDRAEAPRPLICSACGKEAVGAPDGSFHCPDWDQNSHQTRTAPAQNPPIAGWLIENDRAQWLSVVPDGGALAWNSDSNHGLCFMKEEDAFDFISLSPLLGVVFGYARPTPHLWLDESGTADRERRLLARLAGEAAMQFELDGMGSFPAEMYDYRAIHQRQIERLREIVSAEQITPAEIARIRHEGERLSASEDRRPVPHPDEGVRY